MTILPPHKFCPEFLVIVAATVWPVTEQSLSHLRTLLDQSIDWEHLLAVARRQRVIGLVHASFSALGSTRIPAPIQATMEAASSNIVRYNLMAMKETHGLIRALHTAKVEAAVLKGIPLGLLAYGSISVRHSKDIDLLVTPQHIDAADLVLRQLGYRRTTPPEIWTATEVTAFRQTRSHFEYVRPGTPFEAELHWRLSQNCEFGVQFLPSSKWQDVQLGGGLSVPTLASADLLEYLCTHGAAHAWSRLKWLADVAAMIRRDKTLVTELRENASRHGTSRAIEQALALCQSLYGLPIPSGSTRSFPVSLLTRIAQATMNTGCAAGELHEHRLRNAEVHASHFLLSFRPKYLWTELLNELLTPPAWTETSPTRGRKMLHHLRKIWFSFRPA